MLTADLPVRKVTLSNMASPVLPAHKRANKTMGPTARRRAQKAADAKRRREHDPEYYALRKKIDGLKSKLRTAEKFAARIPVLRAELAELERMK